MTPIEQVRAKCAQVVALAMSKYQVDLSKVAISFDLKGRVAGWACSTGSMFGRERKHLVKFNHDMITRGDPEVLADMINDTVPHELAHIVCFIKPTLGKNHDYGWASVCRALGGTGRRTHDNEVVYGRGITYEYTTDRGHKVRLNERRHQHIQTGRSLSYRKGLGTVSLMCAYSIVGNQGRTLAAPIVRLPVNHPAQIEAAVRGVPVYTKEVPIQSLIPTPAVRPSPVFAPVAGTRAAITGESKAATSRRIMLSGYNGGQTYETIIAAMIAVCGYDRALARATFKANSLKVGISSTFC